MKHQDKGSQKAQGASFQLANLTVRGMGKISSLQVNQKSANEPPLILMVEDDPITQKIHLHYLQNKGYQVDVVANGMDAIKSFQNTAYSLVLLDGELPDISGFELAKQLHELDICKGKKSLTPLLLVTSLSKDYVNKVRISTPINEFLNKPVTSNQLCELVYRWLWGKQKTRNIVLEKTF